MKTLAQYLVSLPADERTAIAEGAKLRIAKLRSKAGAGQRLARRNRAY